MGEEDERIHGLTLLVKKREEELGHAIEQMVQAKVELAESEQRERELESMVEDLRGKLQAIDDRQQAPRSRSKVLKTIRAGREALKAFRKKLEE